MIRYWMFGAALAVATSFGLETLCHAQESVDSGSGTGIKVEDFFRGGEISRVSLSPDGRLVAYRKGDDLVIGNPEMGYSTVKEQGAYAHDMEWSGPMQLVTSTAEGRGGKRLVTVVDLKIEGTSIVMVDSNYFWAPGYVLDALPDDPKRLMFVHYRRGDKGVEADIYRINPYKEYRFQTGQKRRINKKFDEARYYVLDARKRPVIGLGFNEAKGRLFLRGAGGSRWKLIWAGRKDEQFSPYSISPDRKKIYGIGNVTTGKRAVVAFDVSSKSFSDVIYEHETVDVAGLITHPESGLPLAALHYESGLAQYEILDKSEEQTAAWLSSNLDSDVVHMVARSDDRDSYLVAVSTTVKPPVYHFCRKSAARCDEVGSAMPWLNDINLSPTSVFTSRSTDGVTVQSFLTLPVNSPGRSPLIVMPHGGPIGVADNRQFSGDVQWLAHNGYAVLQVNYRGSDGYGKQFIIAGLREWGRGIEDDIEAALDDALENNPSLDRNKVGIFGGSYGGYSALQSLVRSPQRYQCAASFAGVTDLTLLFNESYIKRSKLATESLIRMIGDPVVEKDMLMSYSPVYNYQKITKPVFLAHGNKDPVVDIEHSWRLRKMLKLKGSTVELHVMDGVGHSFDYVKEYAELYEPLMTFLDQHLK